MVTNAAHDKREQAEEASRVLAAVPGVTSIAIFGSVARGQTGTDSDIDLIVLGTDDRLTPSRLRRRLPVALQDAPISLSYHTARSLEQYLRRWTRFGAHLRREGRILYDPNGELRRLLSIEIPISTAQELDAQRRHLANYEHVGRFGGRLLFPLAHLYRIGRAAVYAILAESGRLEFDREEAFRMIIELYPGRAADVTAIAELAPFYDWVRSGSAATRLPFDPAGVEAEVRFIRAKEAIVRLIALGGRCREP
jgi:predicted nucleotidyltransferase